MFSGVYLIFPQLTAIYRILKLCRMFPQFSAIEQNTRHLWPGTLLLKPIFELLSLTHMGLEHSETVSKDTRFQQPTPRTFGCNAHGHHDVAAATWDILTSEL